MPLTTQEMQQWCEMIVAGREANPELALNDYLEAIPSLDSLADLPAGTTVLIRADVDAKPGEKIGDGDVRLRSMVETLKFGREKGWKMVLFGHIGRKPEGTLAAVATRLGELMQTEVSFISDWWCNDSLDLLDSAVDTIHAAKNGSLTVLENTRKYPIERVLWKADKKECATLAADLAKYSNALASKIGTVYIHEAFSAGSLDASCVVAPATMQRVAMGRYLEGQFKGPMMRCLETSLVVFSGLKIDKLDDLEAMIARGTIRTVFAAGSLAMVIRKAIAALDGTTCCIGAAEDPAHSTKPYYIPQERIDQATALVKDGREKGINFVVPVDSVIEDGSAVDVLKPSDQQFDIGPKSCDAFDQGVTDFISAENVKGSVAFHNGVFGMFEDSRFEEGTRRWIAQLLRMKEAGVEVYVGGGEGGKALERYGNEDWVTHVFTAGGTVLNALGSEPVPYLVALYAASKKANA